MRLTRYMGAVNTDKLPVGKRAREAFVTALEASDDRAERHYLELKSGFDLNEKAHRRKVVKFILGAAHRDPARAARHFEGHAVMVLGLPLDGVRGLPKFEVKDLEREINAFAGPSPPGWDIDTIPVEGGREIVLIIVDPPSGAIWPVLKDGDPLWSGDIYLRADGETRKATGPEVVAMLSRSTPGRILDISVEPVGGVEAIVVDRGELRKLVEWHVDRLESQVESGAPRSPFASLQSSFNTDRRSRDAFIAQIDEWAADALEEPAAGVYDLAAQMTRPFAVRIINNTTTSLKDVRLDLAFDTPLTALDWEEKDDRVDLFPNRPRDWGNDSYLTAISLESARAFPSSHGYEGAIRIDRREPAELVVELRRLHAEQTITTRDDDVVLIAFVDDYSNIPPTVAVNWRLVAGEVNEVLTGTFPVPLSASDWRGPLHSVISGTLGRESTADET